MYLKHLKNSDRFKCTSEYPNTETPKPLTFSITGQGLSIKPIESNEKKSYTFVQKSYGSK